MINKKYGTNHLYQTPKNIVVSQKNDKEIKPELNRKTKYRKILVFFVTSVFKNIGIN